MLPSILSGFQCTVADILTHCIPEGSRIVLHCCPFCSIQISRFRQYYSSIVQYKCAPYFVGSFPTARNNLLLHSYAPPCTFYAVLQADPSSRRSSRTESYQSASPILQALKDCSISFSAVAIPITFETFDFWSKEVTYLLYFDQFLTNSFQAVSLCFNFLNTFFTSCSLASR